MKKFEQEKGLQRKRLRLLLLETATLAKLASLIDFVLVDFLKEQRLQ
jgi:hypothetical protein